MVGTPVIAGAFVTVRVLKSEMLTVIGLPE
jgi:hypothetical protein